MVGRAAARHSSGMQTTLVIAVFAAALAAAPTFAVEKPGRQAERAFISDAARGNMFEEQAGRLATTRAESKKVKEFGRRMQDDHSKLQSQTKGLAQREGAPLPKRLDERQRKTIDRLSKLRGAEFDREYMSTMVDDHETDVKKFQDKAENAADPEVKSFAKKARPTLEDHLQQARDVQSSLSHAASGVPGTSMH